MNFLETFLKLTEYTIPYKHEDCLSKYLPNGTKRDKIGNYYIKIGESKTLFTSHLDTYCKKKEKVNHIIDGNIIKTDGTTILGGDNKCGVTILLYLIEQKVPGTYFFFCGEEPIISGGLYGSSKLARLSPDFISQFERAVAFDRKKTGSIITRQSAQPCCSDEFADALIKEFAKQGMSMQKDGTGYYTDTAAFLHLISECTNISAGGWNEHHNDEYVDISYLEKTAIAAAKINWEGLPSVRKAKSYVEEKDDDEELTKKYGEFYYRKKDEELFKVVTDILEDEDFVLMNTNEFKPGRDMIFNQWFKEIPTRIKIYNGDIFINDQKIGLKFMGELRYLKKYDEVSKKLIKDELLRALKINPRKKNK